MEHAYCRERAQGCLDEAQRADLTEELRKLFLWMASQPFASASEAEQYNKQLALLFAEESEKDARESQKRRTPRRCGGWPATWRLCVWVSGRSR